MNRNQLNELIASQRLRWETTDNEWSALPLEQKRARLGAVPPAGSPSLLQRERVGAARQPMPAAAALPAAVDWRSKNGNWVTQVEDQGYCGSCVAFGCVAAVESHVRIARGSANLAVDLSEADLWFCWGPTHGAGRCPDGGWWPDQALQGLEQGIVDSACFPYTSVNQNCSRCADAQSRLTKITGWHTVATVADMKNLLAVSGPLITCFTVYEDFYSYQSGVYSPVNGPSNPVIGGHCVCVVGYDDGNHCWICKNSWGTGFGESGFFRIAYGVCGIDAEMDAIEGIVPPQGNTQHVVYRAMDNRIHELWSGRSGWSEGGLAAGTVHATAAAGDPAGYAVGDTQHVVYRAVDNRIHELWWSPGGGWREGGLAAGTVHAPAAAGNPAGYAVGDTQHVVYRAVDNRIHELWWSPGGGWREGGLAAGTVHAPAAAGNPAGYAVGDAQHVVYRAVDNRIHELWWSPGGGWRESVLAAGTTHAPAAAGNPAGYAVGDTQHVVYRAVDNRIHELWSSGSGWAEGGLAAGTVHAPAAAGNPAGYAVGDTQHVVYRAVDNRIHELWWSPGGGWREGGLAAGTVHAPAAAGDPAGYAVSDAQHVVYRGVGGSIHGLWWSPGGGWRESGLAAGTTHAPAAVGNPAGYIQVG